MGALVVLLFLATMALTTNSYVVPTQTHLLMPSSGGVGLHIVNCESWRFGVETNNVRGWSVVPSECANYVGTYMESDQYESDCNATVDEAIKYVDDLEKIADNDIWVFDIDETALSNLEYYRRDSVAYGAKGFNGDNLREWFKSGQAKALGPVLRLYKHLILKKVKIVFLTAVSDDLKTVREENLKKEGYDSVNDETLILKTNEDKGLRGPAFKEKKRKELVEKDKKNIIGNIGDQWSDVSGTNVGKRTFKLPNPMYYL